MTATCDYCGDAIVLGADDVVRARVSIGFGAGNDRWTTYCGRDCRARARGDDVVLATTQQLTLDAFDPTATRSDAVAWSV